MNPSTKPFSSHAELKEHLKKLWELEKPFKDIGEFLRVTGRIKDPPPVTEPNVAPPRKPRPDGEAPRKPRCTKAEKRARKASIAEWLVRNASTQQIVESAKKNWGIGRRTVQLYIREIKAEWANEASQEDYLAHQWLSKRQYDGHLYKAAKALDQLDDPKEVGKMLRIIQGLQKERDRMMAQAQEHRKLSRRDTSPDSRQAKHQRSGMLVMPLSEFQERMNNIRLTWYGEFQKEFERLNGLRETQPVWSQGKQIHEGYKPPPDTPQPVQVPLPPEWHDPYYMRNEKSKELYGKDPLGGSGAAQ